MALTHDDNSYKSRKWAAFMLTSALIILSGKIVPAAAVDGVIFGLITAMGIYCGANVTRDWAALKSGQLPISTTPKTDAAKDTVAAKKVVAEAAKDEEGS
jgi:hypothetical protein